MIKKIEHTIMYTHIMHLDVLQTILVTIASNGIVVTHHHVPSLGLKGHYNDPKPVLHHYET